MSVQQSRTEKPPRGARNRVRRHPERGRYDRESVDAVLDAGWIGHLAFVVDGQPYALPMLYVRAGDQLFLHGAVRSRLLVAAGSEVPLSFTVTHVDGLVLARSWFTHSVNYRSVVVIGTARPVRKRAEKLEAMRLLVDHIVPGRSADSRAPSEKDLKATEIIAITISEASAKVRAGAPRDVEADMDLPVWAGQLPLRTVADAPIADEACDQPLPGYIKALRKGDV